MSLFAAVVAALATLPATGPAPLTPPVADVAARAPHRELRVIVQQRPGADASAAVRGVGGTILRRVPLIDGLAVRVPAAGAARIAEAPAVRAVSLDAAVVGTARDVGKGELATAFNQSIRADRAWAVGVTGRHVGVAVIDTGIRGDLPDFRVSRANPRSRVAVNAVVNPAAKSADDSYGHGTHIAGLVGGNGFARDADDALHGRYMGVAPQAHLIAIKAGDEDGDASVLDVIDGLQFAVDHRADYGIRVVNLSLSSRVAESHLTDPLDAAVEAAWKAGIVVVAAVGNRGEDPAAVSYAPGNDPWVISVGAVDDQGTKDIDDDALTSWSSRGTTQDGYAKPDVLAPGARLASVVPSGARYRALCPQCVVDRDYFRVSGTSMAAAITSGAVAGILQVHPDWTPDQVKRALMRRSRPVRDPTGGEAAVDAGGDELPDDTEATDTIVGGEIAMDKVLRFYDQRDPTAANIGLPLNSILDPATGAIDYTRTSLTAASWTRATDPLRTTWTLTDWMRTSLTHAGWRATEGECIELARTSLTRTSLTSWSGAEIAAAQDECAALFATVDTTRTSLTRTSLTNVSWASFFSK